MIATEKSSIDPLSAPRKTGWKAVISGKGGVGKTTITALLALCAAQEGDKVLAVDAHPQGTLAYSLGVPLERARSIVPLPRNTRYIEGTVDETTETGDEQTLSRIGDMVRRFAIDVRDQLQLLVIESVERSASGCLCSEDAQLSGIIRYLTLQEKEIVLMDTQAGMEFSDGASASGFHHALIITEPTFSSLIIAEQSARQFLGLGIPHLHMVINKIHDEEDISRVKEFATGLTCYEHVFSLPYEEEVRRHDPDISGLLSHDTPFISEIWKIHRTMKNTPQ
jgi:CO dehydrogenase maturation factor